MIMVIIMMLMMTTNDYDVINDYNDDVARVETGTHLTEPRRASSGWPMIMIMKITMK